MFEPSIDRHGALAPIDWLEAFTREVTGQCANAVRPCLPFTHSDLRLRLDDGRTLLATRRTGPARGGAQAGILSALAEEGLPVPKILGHRDGILLIQDPGYRRLSDAVRSAAKQDRVPLLRSALDMLDSCRAAIAARPHVLADLPVLGMRCTWLEDLTSHVVFLSHDLGLAVPQVDLDAVLWSLIRPAAQMTRWRARLSQAAVAPDGRIVWLDWDLAGRRAGGEDVAWLTIDPDWSLDGAATMDLLDSHFAGDTDGLLLVTRMAALLAARRISTRLHHHGGDEDDVSFVGPGAGDVALCQRMAALCDPDPLCASFGPWFRAIGEKIGTRTACERSHGIGAERQAYVV